MCRRWSGALALVLVACAISTTPQQTREPIGTVCEGECGTVFHNDTEWSLEIWIGWGDAGRVAEIIGPGQSSRPVVAPGEAVHVRVEGAERSLDERHDTRVRREMVCVKR